MLSKLDSSAFESNGYQTCMTEPQNLPRVYGDKEIGRILKRATELQHDEPSAPNSVGITLADLEEIAAEAGIDPKYLRRAAMEVDSDVADSSFLSKVVGEDVVLIRDVTLPGELPDDGFERIVTAIQSQAREHGQPSLLGRTLTWRAETASKSRTIQVVVTSRDGHTHLRLEENLSQLALGMFAGGTAGIGIGVGVGAGVPIAQLLGSVVFAFAAPIGTIALTYIGARQIYREVVRRRNRAITDIFERAVAEAEASIASVTVAGSEPMSGLPPGS